MHEENTSTTILSFLQHLPVAAWVMSANNLIVREASRKAVDLFETKDYRNKPLRLIFPFVYDHLSAFLQQNILSPDNYYQHVLKIQDGNGHDSFFKLSVSFIRQEPLDQLLIACMDEVTDVMQLREENLEHQQMMDLVPQMIWHADENGNTYFFNKVYRDYVGLDTSALAGARWLELIHPDDVARTERVWKNAFQNGHHSEVEHRVKGADGTYKWFLTRGTPVRREDHTIIKWFGTTTDIHVRMETEKELEARVQQRTRELETQRLFVNSVLDVSLNAVAALEAVRDNDGHIIDFVFLMINRKFKQITNLNESIIGDRYLRYFPYSMNNGVFDMYCRIVTTGKSETLEIYSTNLNLNAWFEVSASKRDTNNIVVTFADVTKQHEDSARIESQRNLLNNILKHSPAGINVYKALRNSSGDVVDFMYVLSNEASMEYSGIPARELRNKTVLEIQPELIASTLFEMAITALTTGKPFHNEYYHSELNKWLELSVVKMDDDHLINLFRDITPIKESHRKLEESASRLAAVFNASQSGIFTFRPVYNENDEIIDFRFGITNPTFASYVQQKPQGLHGELGSKWFPGYLHNGVFDMYKNTFETGIPQRMEVHYNVDQHDLYLDILSTKVADEVLVTFNDLTAVKKAQLQMEKYIEDLKHSNANLEEFAYAASHDMKEPIRKIGFFADALRHTLRDKLDEEQTRYFDRMEVATKRMRTLIDDLLLYSFVTRGLSSEEEVDLNEMVQLVIGDLELEISEKKAYVHVSPLPTIIGQRRQLQQLFQNLISNSLKYSKADRPPIITIGAADLALHELPVHIDRKEGQSHFSLISVADNGIGFEQKHAQRIFNVFTRLHGNELYRGTGVGLAIVQRIVTNHRGYIWAESEPDVGTTFRIILPVI
jgi:PAS domain S-box-containing protein